MNNMKYFIRSVCFAKSALKNIQVLGRFFSTSMKNNGFKYEENKLAHSIMEQLPEYQSTMANRAIKTFLLNNCSIKSNNSTLKRENNEVISTFIELSLKNKNETLEHGIDEELSNSICQEIRTCSDNQILSALYALSLWPPSASAGAKVFKKLWNTLDVECTLRIKNWNSRTLLLVADTWHLLQLNRISLYNSAMIKNLVFRMNELTPQQFIQLTFYINLQRNCDSKTLILIEDKLIDLFPSLSLQEISIATLAFFKNQYKIQSDLFITLVKRMRNELETLDSATVVFLTKTFNFRNKPVLEPYLISLLDASCPFIKKWDLIASIRMGKITTTCCIDHPLFCETLVLHAMPSMSDIRIKDISSLLLIMTMFNYQFEITPNFYANVIAELENRMYQEEIVKFSHDLIQCVFYLTQQKLYPENVIKHILSEDFLNQAEYRKQYEWHDILFAICCSAKIEWPNYEKYCLSDNVLNTIKQKNIVPQNLEGEVFREKFLNDVKQTLVKILGSEKFISSQNILPYYVGQDILIRKTMENKIIPFGEPLPPLSSPSQNYKWCYININQMSSYTSNTKKSLGYIQTKLRLLKTLGFHLVEIPWFEYYPLSKERKESYIKNKIYEI